MVRCFFYGSYMDPDVLRAYGARSAGTPVPAVLPDWDLGFTPHANIHRVQGRSVHGFLMELPSWEVARLYGPDGFVTDYAPVAVTVQSRGGPVPATTYVAPWTPGMPDAAYLASYLAICRRMRLPPPAIAAIEASRSVN